jgi:hypothetical protein
LTQIRDTFRLQSSPFVDDLVVYLVLATYVFIAMSIPAYIPSTCSSIAGTLELHGSAKARALREFVRIVLCFGTLIRI